MLSSSVFWVVCPLLQSRQMAPKSPSTTGILVYWSVYINHTHPVLNERLMIILESQWLSGNYWTNCFSTKRLRIHLKRERWLRVEESIAHLLCVSWPLTSKHNCYITHQQHNPPKSKGSSLWDICKRANWAKMSNAFSLLISPHRLHHHRVSVVHPPAESFSLSDITQKQLSWSLTFSTWKQKLWSFFLFLPADLSFEHNLEMKVPAGRVEQQRCTASAGVYAPTTACGIH